MRLNPDELAVIDCQIMGFKEEAALAYCKREGQAMSKSQYYRILGRLDGTLKEQLFEVAKRFPYLHLQRLQEVDVCRREMWKCYQLLYSEKKYSPASAVLKRIVEIQPYASAYAEATKEILEKEIENEKSRSIPSIL